MLRPSPPYMMVSSQKLAKLTNSGNSYFGVGVRKSALGTCNGARLVPAFLYATLAVFCGSRGLGLRGDPQLSKEWGMSGALPATNSNDRDIPQAQPRSLDPMFFVKEPEYRAGFFPRAESTRILSLKECQTFSALCDRQQSLQQLASQSQSGYRMTGLNRVRE